MTAGAPRKTRSTGTRWRHHATLLLVLWLAWLGRPAGAAAHAEVVGSIPPPNAVLLSAPRAVRLVFSERVLATLSQIAVDDPAGRRVDMGPSTVSAGGVVMQVALNRDLQPGPYSVLWTSVSADDGHILQGSYTFVLGQDGSQIALPSGALSGVPPPIAAAVGLTRILADWLGLAGTALWVGLPLYLWLVLQPALRRLERAPRTTHQAPPGLPPEIGQDAVRRAAALLQLGIGVTLLSTLAGLVVQATSLALATGSDPLQALLGQVAGSQYGLVWLAREVLLVAVFVLGALPARSAAGQQAAGWSLAPGEVSGSVALAGPGVATPAEPDTGWVAAVGLVYLALVALDGHAATARPVPLALAVDWLHALATAIWLGGTVGVAAALVPALRALPRTTRARALAALLPAFSPWALGAVGVLAVTGMGNAALRSTDLAAWLGSAYGRALLVKIALFAAMLAVSRYHAFVLRPRLSRLLAAEGQAQAAGHEESSRDGGDALAETCRALERWLAVNPSLAAGILLCVAIMASSPPPV